MSNIYIRFGAEPSQTQVVAPELVERNIHMIRREPSAVQVQGGATTIQPNFSIYKAFLPSFMYSIARGGDVHVRTGATMFPGLALPTYHTRLPIAFPDLLVHWNINIAEEVRDEMRSKGWRDTMTKGKTAMVKDRPTIEDAVYAKSKGCKPDTPTGENSMNLNSFRSALKICDILALFLRLHQYPAFVDDDHESEFNAKAFQVTKEETEEAEESEMVVEVCHSLGYDSPY